jgi:hypothetical protein
MTNAAAGRETTFSIDTRSVTANVANPKLTDPVTGISLSLLDQPANDRTCRPGCRFATVDPAKKLLNSLAYNQKMSPKI